MLDDPAYDYFPTTTHSHSLGSSQNSWGFPTPPERDWPTHDYFAESTPSAPPVPYDSLSGRDSVLPDPWATETYPDPYERGLFATAVTDGAAAYVTASEASPVSEAGGFAEPAFQPTASPPSSRSGVAPEMVRYPASGRTSKRRTGGSVSVGTSGPADLDLSREGERPSTGGNSSSGHKPQLRTAFRKAKSARRQSRSSTSSEKNCIKEEDDLDDSLTAEERRARHSHNIVEKQYRNRLNAQFVRLLAVLPADQRDGNGPRRKSTGGGSSGSGDDAATVARSPLEEKRLSKAEVLDLATKRIKTLEYETLRLQKENSELIHSVDAMTGCVVNRGLGKS